ncbi:unnamed protein product, partial [Symbiodinium natans]
RPRCGSSTRRLLPLGHDFRTPDDQGGRSTLLSVAACVVAMRRATPEVWPAWQSRNPAAGADCFCDEANKPGEMDTIDGEEIVWASHAGSMASLEIAECCDLA